MEKSRESPREKVASLPTSSGVYVMKDALGNVIYIGKAVNLRRRVGQYFTASYRKRAYNPKVASLAKCIADFDFYTTRSEADALVLESALIKKWKPRYNTLEKDNKNFLHLRVEMFSPLPRFVFARHRNDDRSLYFGPYIGSAALRSALGEIKKKFGILLSDAHPKKDESGKWILYDDARAEISGFANVVTREEYAERVKLAIDYLRGRDDEAVKQAREKMREASDAMDYEKAAKWRDIISAIAETRAANAHAAESADISRSAPEVAKLALKSLKAALKMKSEPRAIECFDISHISGSFCVASCVRFEGGEPARQKYRRFKIKSFMGNDDFRAMREVVGRRYSRLHGEGSPMPDLVLIDGGKGQVVSALAAFDEAGIKPTKVAGLAKREETIVNENLEEILLPRRDEGLRLLQRVRDEAHRFANSFNESLRSKKIRESILDDFRGLGEKRKAAILKHFGSIARVKSAGVEKLQEVEGVGAETAKRLREFLDANFSKKQ